MPKSQILKGHKKQGKNFVTPLNQIQNIEYQRYINDILPETIWCGLLNQAVGYNKAARIFEDLFTTIDQSCDPSYRINPALLSFYKNLTNDQRIYLKEELYAKPWMNTFLFALMPLHNNYIDFPLSFIYEDAREPKREKDLDSLKMCVHACFDKFQTPAVALHGMLLFALLVLGKMKFPSNMEVPDFNAVFDKPDSEEAKRAAGFMRANALSCYGISEVSKDWPRYFWNRNFEITSCWTLGKENG